MGWLSKQGMFASNQILGWPRWPAYTACSWWSLFAFQKLVQTLRDSGSPTSIQNLDGALVYQLLFVTFIYPINCKLWENHLDIILLDFWRAEIFKKPNGTQICFTAKAFNGRVLSQWLNDCLCDAVSKGYHDNHDQLALLSSCMLLGFY